MKAFYKKAASAGLAALMAMGMLTGCGSSGLDGTKTVTTVNGEAVPMGVLSYYAKYQQAWLYSSYASWFGTTDIFDSSASGDDDAETVGESMKLSCLDEIEEMVLLSQHAEEYGVSLTDEEEAEISQVAQDYLDKNDEEVQAKVGASKENVEQLLRLFKIKSKMLEPMVADVDKNISDEEAQQTSVMLVTFYVDEETEGEDAASMKALAEDCLKQLQEAEDPANVDMTEFIGAISDLPTVSMPHYSTNDPSDSYMNSAVMDAVATLTEEGQIYDQVITADDDSAYYIVRMELLNDEEETESQKTTLLSSKEEDAYNELLTSWQDAATITRDEGVLATLTLTDEQPFGMAESTEESTEETTEDTTEESTEDSTAEESTAE